jgi:lipopolysaccharide/colanic/teichoic acid biosynthesis glycosyltransferase
VPDVKRFLDLLASLAALVALIPVFGLIALIVRLESRGPVIFRQRRIGLGGKPFWMFKFRSMREDAPQTGPWYTIPGDPRITRVGRLLRRTSMDELPQLVNVLRGEMSLVGPRPDVPEQMELYTDAERQLRHRVRPGLTGWAQVLSRNEGTVEERKAFDLEYVRRQSLVFDARILLLTVRQVLMRGSC